jgi:hypothetical protein
VTKGIYEVPTVQGELSSYLISYYLLGNIMKDLDSDKFPVYAVSVILVLLMPSFLNRVPRSRGKKIVYHGLFVLLSGLLLFFLPEEIQDEVFSSGGVGKLYLHHTIY